MKTWALLLFLTLPVALSEVAAWWWTHPPHPSTAQQVLDLIPPESATWNLHGDLYREVQPSLLCSTGWIADIAESQSPGMRVAFFKWDDTSTTNTMEAFRHLPEQCMGSIGMELEKVHPTRRHGDKDQTLRFDSTLFRPHGGGQAVHIFKCVWVSGLEAPDLRDGLLGESSITDLRRQRLAAAASRFKPRHTRVIMGAVAGMPTEDLAWHRFSSEVLTRLQWPQEKPGD